MRGSLTPEGPSNLWHNVSAAGTKWDVDVSGLRGMRGRARVPTCAVTTSTAQHSTNMIRHISGQQAVGAPANGQMRVKAWKLPGRVLGVS